VEPPRVTVTAARSGAAMRNRDHECNWGGDGERNGGVDGDGDGERPRVRGQLGHGRRKMVRPLFLNLEDRRIVLSLEKETSRTSGETLLKMNVQPFCFVIGRTVLRHVLDKKLKTKILARVGSNSGLQGDRVEA